jgi:hypothetical protein
MKSLDQFRRGELEKDRAALIETAKRFNEAVVVYNTTIDAARDDIEGYVSAQSEAWRRSAMAKHYKEWSDSLEDVKLHTIDADIPPTIPLTMNERFRFETER